MIDLHTHVLFAVDDGAADLDEALAMVRRSAEDGITELVATPHTRHPQYWNDDTAVLRSRWQALVDRALTENLDIQLHFGAEIAISTASLDEVQQLPKSELPALGTSRWLLLELDWLGLGPDPEEVVHEVQVVGYKPLIAHPERVRWLVAEPRRLESLVQAGARLQVTGQSLVGDLGPEVESATLDLMDRGLVHCVASDAHDLKLRPPGLSRARERVRDHWGEAAAQRLFVDNPRRILDDAAAASLEPPQASGGDRRRKGFVGRLLGGLR